MSSKMLVEMTTKQLVERFLTLALDQGVSVVNDDNATYNRLYDRMSAVELELKERDGDQRFELLALLRHQKAHVRLKAAIATLKIAPGEARAALQKLVDEKDYPQAYDAFGMLRALDAGRYVPE